MRYISTQGFRPEQVWIDAADALTDQLVGKSAEERKEIIKQNQKHWGKLKHKLLELSHGKCWYSEAKGAFDHQHLEHFRPKGALKDKDGLGREGYWWLAFEWTNYCVMGGVGNVKKSSYFPLMEGSFVARTNTDDHHLEQPVLLSPMEAADVKLVSFNEDGSLVPVDEKNPDVVKRVEQTAEHCKLNDEPVKRERRIVWSKCANRVYELRKYIEKGVKNPVRERELFKDIADMLVPQAEYSATCKASLLKSGHPWAKDLVGV